MHHYWRRATSFRTDNDPTNEIETWSTLAGIPSGFSDDIDNVDDADNDSNNELQTISKTNSTVILSNGGGSFTDAVDDADNDISNELITSFSFASDELVIKDGGGSYIADFSDYANNWTQDVSDNLRYFSGDVIIGDNVSPTNKLTVHNGGMDMVRNSSSIIPHIDLMETQSSDGARIKFRNSSSGTNFWSLFGHANSTSSSSQFNLFHNNTGNIITTQGDGDVGITGTPDIDFHVFHGNNGGSDGMKLENTSNGKWIRMYVSSGTGDLRFFSTLHGSDIIGAIDDDTGVYTALSDARKKKDFEDLRFDGIHLWV